MVETSRSNTRPLEEVVDGGEGSNKRARNLAGMLLFGENDTSDWQETVWEAQLTEVLEDHDRQEILMDQQAQPDTDVPGVWRCQIEPKSDLYGDKTGKLLDPEKVIKGRLTELKHMNDHHVYDWIDEAERFRKAPRWKLLVGSTTSNHVTVMKTMSGVALLCNSTMLTNASMFIKARHR